MWHKEIVRHEKIAGRATAGDPTIRAACRSPLPGLPQVCDDGAKDPVSCPQSIPVAFDLPSNRTLPRSRHRRLIVRAPTVRRSVSDVDVSCPVARNARHRVPDVDNGRLQGRRRDGGVQAAGVGQQAAVEGHGDRAGRPVVHRPQGADDVAVPDQLNRRRDVQGLVGQLWRSVPSCSASRPAWRSPHSAPATPSSTAPGRSPPRRIR